MSSRKKHRSNTARVQPAAGEEVVDHVATPAHRWRSRWLALALVVAATLAYLPALSAPFVLDDWVTIDASSRWEHPPGMPTAGRPLVLATLAANYQLNRVLGVDQQADPNGPHKAVGYRLFNLLLHLLTGALLFGVIRRAMSERRIRDDWRAIAGPVAGVVTALWLLHPIQSEVINYIVQRSEALASLFYLATLYASQRAWDAAPAARMRWYAAAVGACALGMLSKEIVITAPIAVMLYDRAFRLPTWRALARPGNGRGWLYLALWVTCLGAFAVFGLNARGDSAGLNEGMTWYGYLYTQCWAIAHYLRLVAWPNALAADYGYSIIRGARGVPGLVLLVAFGVATLIAWTRVERFGWFAWLGSMFFILLAPSSSVVPVVLEVGAERRIYLALAVVLVLVVVGAEWARRRAAARVSPRWLVAGGAGIAAALAVATAVRSTQYAEPELLWCSAVRAMPDNPRALVQLGVVLATMDPPRPVAAESAFSAAVAKDSSCRAGCLQYGTLLARQGRFKEAIPLLEREAARGVGTKSSVAASRLLALALMKQGDYKDAIPYLEGVVQWDPTMSNFVNLGVAYVTMGRRDEAIATFRYMATFGTDNAQLQQLSKRLEDGVDHPEALSNLQEFAFSLTNGWM